MTYDIATLLKRNLQEVFGEADDVRRQAVAAEIFASDAEFHEPHGVFRGPAEIARIAGVIRASHPDFQYRELGPAEVLHETAGRVRWVSGAPGEPPAYAGTDFIIARDGRISGLYLFFDTLPGEGDVLHDKTRT
ncbi:nuclear transport factor 2 family protein [Agrobacterium sp. Ap1]|uniref:nuclear transport factor 2 family protein n=1 Tax=Agrobacterium sp. Ap1 TaxID=2815337 RepID=UPI001A8F9E40|nr:nuclear transport factor 2 family protein [Agrobacterium sp. Ap1]MBO0139910.1 nuclear transport factor 2 family protein [Agrobacterium sp. Ap1]